MRCAKCGIDHVAKARGFANSVRRRSISDCAKCAFENTPEAKFCAQCAAPLDAARPIRAEADAHDGLTGERRHLTVLFCDLVGSTEIASHLDPEEWREIVADYHRAAAKAIERFGGSVAPVPRRRRDGLLRLARGPRQRRRACRARRPGDPGRDIEAQRTSRRIQSSLRGSASIRAR